jgi:hypothetical protein
MARAGISIGKFNASYVSVLTACAVVVLLGIGTALIGRAATASISAEAEAGTITAGAVAVSDAAASGGKSVQFKAPITGGRIVNVSTASQLTAALAAAVKGDVITMADGTYSGNFVSTASGASAAPITLTGSRNAIIKGSSISSGYGMQIGTKNSATAVSYWQLKGFSVTNAQKGIIFDNVQHSLIDSVSVHDVGMEAIHLRDFSSDNIVSNNVITMTGRSDQAYGEGLYVGTAVSNWDTFSQAKPDGSNRNQLLNNRIDHTSAESIDIKEGTHGGTISGNTLDGTGMCYDTAADCNSADSLIDMKGEGWTIKNNTGLHVHTTWSAGGQLNDGFQIHVIKNTGSEGSGNNNVFSLNKISDVGGYGINVTGSPTGVVVKCDNTVTTAGKGLTNLTCQ